MYAMEEGDDAWVEVRLSTSKVYAQFIVRLTGKGAGAPLPPRSSISESSYHGSFVPIDTAMTLSPSSILSFLLLFLFSLIIF